MTKTILTIIAALSILLSYTAISENSQLKFDSNDIHIAASCTDSTIEPSVSPDEGGGLILSLLVVLLVTITAFLITLLFFWYEMNKNRK